MKNKILARSIAFLLVMLFSVSLPATIAHANFNSGSYVPNENVEYFAYERGSAFILSIRAGMVAHANGVINVSFAITGTQRMDQIGATRIQIFENGVLVRTITTATHPGIMTSNATMHSWNIMLQGVVGRSYHAVVTYQAGLNGGWDSRTLTSPTAVARH